MRTQAEDLENALISREPSARVLPSPEAPGHWLAFMPDGRCTPIHQFTLEAIRTPAALEDAVTNILSRLARTRPSHCLVTWQHAWTLFSYLLTNRVPEPAQAFSTADRALNDRSVEGLSKTVRVK